MYFTSFAELVFSFMIIQIIKECKIIKRIRIKISFELKVRSLFCYKRQQISGLFFYLQTNLKLTEANVIKNIFLIILVFLIINNNYIKIFFRDLEGILYMRREVVTYSNFER